MLYKTLVEIRSGYISAADNIRKIVFHREDIAKAMEVFQNHAFITAPDTNSREIDGIIKDTIETLDKANTIYFDKIHPLIERYSISLGEERSLQVN